MVLFYLFFNFDIYLIVFNIQRLEKYSIMLKWDLNCMIYLFIKYVLMLVNMLQSVLNVGDIKM